MIPLPAHPYDTAQVFYRCVNTEGLIVYCQNRYSLPWRYIGLTLPVRITLKINGKSYRAHRARQIGASTAGKRSKTRPNGRTSD